MKGQQTTITKKNIIKDMLNADEFPYKGEYNTQPSLTIPDQTMELSQLIDRFTRGLPITTFKPVYDETGDMPDPRRLDIAEYNEMRKNAALELQRLTQEKEQRERQETENQQNELINQRVEEEIKKRQNVQNL
jgi:hypothetical protein